LVEDRPNLGFGEKLGIQERIAGQRVFLDAAWNGAKGDPNLPEELLSSRRG
jgi:hypothetical protein